jgi:amino acid transporter
VENVKPHGNAKISDLIRGLGLWSAIAVIVGSMIGQALFLLASDMARELGSPTRVIAVWIVGGIIVLFGAFCYAEFGAAIPEAGGEVSDPQKNIPRAAVIGSLLVISLYVLLNCTYFHVLGLSGVAQSEYVASDAMAALIGNSGAKWITLAMIVSAFGTLHATFLTGPRVPFAMARDGHFFAFTRRIHPVFHTPSSAVIFQGCVAILLVLTGTYQENIFVRDIRDLALFRVGGHRARSAPNQGTCPASSIPSLGIPMDTGVLWYCGMRYCCKSLDGSPYSILNRIGDHPSWSPILSSLA